MLLDLRLAELLCTRLCHDLTGPIGAVSNGAEFLGEKDFAMQDQAVEPIISSAEQAVVRLQFYRQAYGRINQGEASLGETRDLVQSFLAETRFTLDWSDSYTDSMEISISRKMSRLILNLLILVMAALPKGGVITLTILPQEDGGCAITLHGKGAATRLPEEALSALYGKLSIEALSPKTVQPYYTMRIAQDMGVTLEHRYDEEMFELRALHP